MYRKNLLNKFSIKLLEQFFKGDPVGFWSHYNFDLRQWTNNWLVFWLLNTFEWPKHREDILTLFVFFDRLQGRIMVFLVAEQDMVKQWTFTWKKGAGYFKSFCMPKFTFKLAFAFNLRLQVRSSALKDETHLSAYAEIGYNYNWKFVEKRVSAKF